MKYYLDFGYYGGAICKKDDQEMTIEMATYGESLKRDIHTVELRGDGLAERAFANQEHRAEYDNFDAQAVCDWLNDRGQGYPLCKEIKKGPGYVAADNAHN